MNYKVEINPDEGFIKISRNSREMLYWQDTEWQESPDLIYTITEAIHLALTNPKQMDLTLSQMGKL